MISVAVHRRAPNWVGQMGILKKRTLDQEKYSWPRVLSAALTARTGIFAPRASVTSAQFNKAMFTACWATLPYKGSNRLFTTDGGIIFEKPHIDFGESIFIE